jgi:hypothetical protein
MWELDAYAAKVVECGFAVQWRQAPQVGQRLPRPPAASRRPLEFLRLISQRTVKRQPAQNRVSGLSLNLTRFAPTLREEIERAASNERRSVANMTRRIPEPQNGGSTRSREPLTAKPFSEHPESAGAHSQRSNRAAAKRGHERAVVLDCGKDFASHRVCSAAHL